MFYVREIGRICYIVQFVSDEKGVTQIESFLDGLPANRQGQAKAAWYWLRQQIPMKGPPHIREKFKKLEGSDGISRFAHGPIRILCFTDESTTLIFTHGFLKKKNRIDRKEIKKAERLRREYFEAKANGELEILP